MFICWHGQKNLKTLYYLRSEAISRADNVTSQAKRDNL